VKLEEASVETQPTSLYERLGGLYVIATAVDDFIATGIPARETALSRATGIPARETVLSRARPSAAWT